MVSRALGRQCSFLRAASCLLQAGCITPTNGGSCARRHSAQRSVDRAEVAKWYCSSRIGGQRPQLLEARAKALRLFNSWPAISFRPTGPLSARANHQRSTTTGSQGRPQGVKWADGHGEKGFGEK